MSNFTVEGIQLEFDSSPDLFSPKNLDKGTELLLKCSSAFNYKNALDWGCGWGAIAMWLGKNNPEAQITAVDSDIAAINAIKINISKNDLSNINVVASHGFSEIGEDQKFDIIASNPPTHRGREVVDSMISESHAKLSADGKLIIVVESRLKPWVARQMQNVFGNYKILQRSRKHVVLLSQK